LFGMRHPPKNANNLAMKMVKELALDESQKSSFLEMGKEHHKAMMEFNQEQKTALQKYFQHLPNEYTGDVSTDLLGTICQVEGNKIDLTYSHFQDVYKLLNKEQLALYKPIVDEALSHILMLPLKKVKQNEGLRK
jgi:hypothetical protein